LQQRPENIFRRVAKARPGIAQNDIVTQPAQVAEELAVNAAQLVIEAPCTAFALIRRHFFRRINPRLPAPAKAALIAAYKTQLLVLQKEGWLTPAQATQLSALASLL